MTESSGRPPAQVDVSLGINALKLEMFEFVMFESSRAVSPELNDS